MTDNDQARQPVMIPENWLKPGAVVPITAETVRVLLDALRAPLQHEAIPEGWKLVPIKPTSEMIKEGIAANDGIVSNIYAAMLASSSLPSKDA